MSYRKNSNQHEYWVSFCKEKQSLIDASTLPMIVFQNEQFFRDYITNGTIQNEIKKDVFSLTQLSDDAFFALEQFIGAFHFDMDETLFDDLNSERRKRWEIKDLYERNHKQD